MLTVLMLLAFQSSQPVVVKIYEAPIDRLKRETRELGEYIDRENARLRRTPRGPSPSRKSPAPKVQVPGPQASESTGWTVSTLPSEHTCEMRAVFGGGTFLAISLDPKDNGYYAELGNSNWKSLESCTKYKIRYELSDSVWEDTETELNSENPKVSSLVSGFEENFGSDVINATQVTIRHENVVLGVLSLRGSGKALPKMVQCARREYQTANVDPFAK